MNIFSRVFGPSKNVQLSHLKGFESRPQQIAMAEQIRQSFENNRHAVIEAGTGVGKTLAYLLPAIEWSQRTGKKIAVSTFTKALQEQLMQKELPRLKKLLNIDFQYALCLGSQNFLCKRRFHKNSLPELFTSSKDNEELRKISQWINSTPTGLVSVLPFEPSPGIWGQFNRDSDLCMRRKSPYFEECFYYKQRKEIEQADILVTNHHIFFAHIASGGKVLPDFDAVIFDEAHTLENVATEYLGYKISNDLLKFHLDSLHNPSNEGGLLRRIGLSRHDIKTGKKLADKTREAAHVFFSEILDKLGIESQKTRIRQKGLVRNTLQGPLNDMIAFFLDILKNVQSKEDEKEWLAMIKKFQEMANQIEIILNIQESNCVYWVEIEKRSRAPRCSLNKAPLEIATVFKHKVLERFEPAIFVSATLAANGRFDLLKSCLGLDDQVRELLLDSPFDYAKNVLLYLPQSMPDPGGRQESTEYYAKAFDETKRLVTLMQGRMFILFTRVELMVRVGLALTRAFPHLSIMKQGDLPPHSLIEKFRKNEHAVLLGTSTFWQGVDVPGRALECVVIWKLPFAVPDDPITEAKMERWEALGKNAFTHYLLPRAVIMTRQGFGRLIRRQTDKGIVVILDPRIRTKGYGKDFLNSLPACRQTSEFDDVEKFFTDQLSMVKPQEIPA
ncbi:MAG: ATP-dependent DNA helicase [Candidatus Omnitrophica bacterium]|nr:ATP-dependent DNA helicase [Candidatus Omnitrophota bacterium]